MPKQGHIEEQIIAALKQYEGGEKANGRPKRIVADLSLRWQILQEIF